MLSQMSRASCMLIVSVVLVKLVVSHILLNYEPHIIWDMNFLGEIFKIESKIDHNSIPLLLVVESHQE